MAKNFNELRNKVSAARRAKVDREYEQLMQKMPLRKLRAARELTQENLARTLQVNQSEVSKIENRADMYVSTLASYVKAMGGELEIRAVFPDGGAVQITQFEELR